MDEKLDRVYDPHSIEQSIYEQWEKSGAFSPSGVGAPYCIMIPPPNVTGSLHMGHAFQNTLMDALIRYQRMKGRNTLWQVGTDHAGIATQMVVERLLNAQGQTREDLGREKFIQKVWEWKSSSGGTITNQLRRLGASVDWSRERFTMDENLSAAVREVFVSLYEDGLIYRGKKLVNWDPVLLTAISDLEVSSEEENGYLWHFRYPIADSDDYVTIATTRPETMLGDTAVAVHPEDERYRHLIGKTVLLPLTERKIPIVADDYVDPSFGSGCLKITPAHDFNDYAVGERHGLDVINIMTATAAIDLPASRYHGMTRERARDAVVEDLKELGLLEKVEPHRLKVPRGDRTQQIIEPYLTDQWFVRTKPLAAPAIAAVKNGTIRFVPKNWERTYFEWMENIQDWCISRQLWWGHRIPAWYDQDGNLFVARSAAAAGEQAAVLHGRNAFELHQDEDVLDTWFSSALWPFSTLGWPHSSSTLQTFYPTNVLVTGFDIIFFWVARMIMFGLKFADDIPFHEIYIHGLVRDSDGQKMSKSKGNILDPLDLIDGIELEPLIRKRTTGLMQPELAPQIEAATREEFPHGISAYGTDALRFTFARLATQGRDIRFDLGQVEGYRNFCNKLWNAARFVLMNAEGVDVLPVDRLNPNTAVEKWIIAELLHTTRNIEDALEQYRFDIASKHLYEFIWNQYCAWFIEFVKISLKDPAVDDECRHSLRQTLLTVLDASVRLLHPFMPFISEAIWRKIADDRADRSIMSARFSDGQCPEDENAALEINWLKAVISSIRNLRSEFNIKPSEKTVALYQHATNQESRWLSHHTPYIFNLARLQSFEPLPESGTPDEQESFVSAQVGNFKILIRTGSIENVEEQIARIDRQIEELDQQIERARTKLDNPQFLQKAPAAVIEKEQNRQLDCERTRQLLTERRMRLGRGQFT